MVNIEEYTMGDAVEAEVSQPVEPASCSKVKFDEALGGFRFKSASCPEGKEMFFDLERIFNALGLDTYVDEQ